MNLKVTIACPECGKPVARYVPIRDDADDGIARPLPLLAWGECEDCWPWLPEQEKERRADVQLRTLKATNDFLSTSEAA